MRAVLKVSASIVLTLLVFILIISGPVLIGREDGRVILDPGAPFRELGGFLRDSFAGAGLEYQAGKTWYSMADTLPRYFFLSLRYILPAALISLGLGLAIGLRRAFRPGMLFGRVLDFLHVLPDFMIAIFLQILSITIYQISHIRVARLAYLDAERSALLLPILTMTITATVFVVRAVEGYVHGVKGQEYILFAQARGLPGVLLIGRHLMVPILYGLRSDLNRLLAMLVGNLFIIERIFRIPGLTGFVFSYSFQRIYDPVADEVVHLTQFNVAFWGFLSIALLYLLVYLVLDLLLRVSIRLLQGVGR